MKRLSLNFEQDTALKEIKEMELTDTNTNIEMQVPKQIDEIDLTDQIDQTVESPKDPCPPPTPPTPPTIVECMWYRVPVAGDGGCMFTSARLGWELIAVLQSIEKEEEITNFILDGNNEVAIRGGFLVRQRICEWYKSGLAKSVPSMGKYTEKDGGRDWCRGDLLAMEMVQREKEVPEEGVERTKAQIKYLLHMMLPKTWGGTPEYFAFAQIFKLKIVIYVPGFPDRTKLIVRDCIEPGNVSCQIPINLLFLPNQRHYELLLSRAQYEMIVQKVGVSKVANIRKIV
jgi:hypothetical protein